MGKHTAYRRQLRTRVLAKYGDKCAKCSFDDKRALELDHIEGRGKAERRATSHDRSTWLLEALRIDGKYQLLCANCNRIKQWERLEWAVPPIT
jgi:hypothetical protein